MLTELTKTLSASNRNDVRREVCNWFLDETPGTGKGDLCARYYYTVETHQDYSIILKRPTGLNKGFDFTVNVTGMYFKKNRRYSNPSHNDILTILSSTKNKIGANYTIVQNIIMQMFNCSQYSFTAVRDITFTDHLGEERPIAIILLAIKWLFIEQDITYWNWSGRNMLMNSLKVQQLV